MKTTKKSVLVCASVAIGTALPASAALNVQVNAFVSGVDVASSLFREHIAQNVCDPTAAINIYVDSVERDPGNGTSSNALPFLSHNAHWVVQCTARAGTGTNLAGRTLAVYKADSRTSSATGTLAVADMTAVQFMNAEPSRCNLYRSGQQMTNGGTYNLYACGSDDIVSQVPDGGVSIVEPSKFVGTLADPTGGYIERNNLKVLRGPNLVFGVVVTKALRDELQQDQGLLVGAEDEANMPSLPVPFVRAITSANKNRWDAVSIKGQSVDLPSTFVGPDLISGTADDVSPGLYTPYIHLCRRAQGSGTHAQFMIHYQRTNCMTGSFAMPSPRSNPSGGMPVTFQAATAGALGGCMHALDTGEGLSSTEISPTLVAGRGAYAIGYQSTLNNVGNSRNYRFVKLNGVAPTLENAFNGEYMNVYPVTYQYRNNNTYQLGGIRAAAPLNAAINELFMNNLNVPGALAAQINQTHYTHAWGQGGFLMATAGSVTAAYDPDDAVAPWARSGPVDNTDSCQPLRYSN